MTAPAVSRQRAVVRVMAALAAAGAVLGAVWAWLAPPVHGIVALTRGGDRVTAALGNEADNWFIAAFLMVGLLSVLAVVSSVALWQWRIHRGPVMLAALAAGNVVAAGVSCAVGVLVAHWRYGSVDVAGAPVSEQHRVHYVVEAPSVFFGPGPAHVALTLVFPAAVATVFYLFGVVSTTRDDLGAWPPVEPRLPMVSATATGRSATAANVPPDAPSSPSA